MIELKNKLSQPIPSPHLETKGIGLALLLSDNFRDQIISFQRAALKHVHLSPVFDRVSNLPHITLVQGNFRSSVSEPALVHHVEGESKRFQGAAVTLGDIVYKDGGWIFLLVAPDPWIRSLHNEAVKICAPEMIAPDMAASTSKVAEYSELERASYLKYGYRYVGDAYLPHITIGRITGDKPEGTVEKLNALFAQSGISRVQPVAQISAYGMGQNGAHAETLAFAAFGNG